MEYAASILELVGRTPLVRLSRLTASLGPVEAQPLMLAKLEMLNPGGSVKDRIGLPMIEAAERAGLLKPGGTIIEPTSGNTGHGLAIAAALKGYRCIFVMADKQSVEKQALLRAYGAEVVLCPTNVAPESPESYYSVAARLARDIPGAFKPDQYWNEENPRAHEATTGPEIWRQTQGRVTHLVASVGTGGTITGIAHHLKAQDPAIRIIGADPEGSVLSGDVARPYLTEGVGEDFMPGTFDPAVVDRWVRVSDRDAFAMARRLTREEGILGGESCGTALVAALDEAARLMREEPATARDAVMVVLLPTAAATTCPSCTTTSGCGPTGSSVRPPRRCAWRRSWSRAMAAASCRRWSWRARPSSWPRPSTRSSGSASARCPSRSGRTTPSRASSARSASGASWSAPTTTPRSSSGRSARRWSGRCRRSPRGRPRRGVPAALRRRARARRRAGGRPAGIVTKLDLLEYLAHRGS